MPRFSVAFGRRRSTVNSEELQQNGPVAAGDQQQQQSSFRVLERTEIGGNKSFDGGHRLLKATTTAVPPKHHYDLSLEDNMFADVKNNRGSGSSNTTKTVSTDTSSRHSNVSTTPSSADLGAQGPQEEWRNSIKKSQTDLPPPKHSSGGFLSKAGRTFSFGGQKKNQVSAASVDDHPLPPPPLPTQVSEDELSRRPRGLTSSTASTATPPKLSEEDFNLNLGGDFGNMFKGSGFDKRASQMTLQANDKSNLGPRSLTSNRVNQPQPSPIKVDRSIKVEASPYSWSSQHSNDNLLHDDNMFRSGPGSPINTDRTSVPPPVPRHGSPLAFRNNVPSDIVEDEDANLLKDSLAASRFLGNSQPSNPSPPGRFRRNEDTFSTGWDYAGSKREEENMFETTTSRPPKPAQPYSSGSGSNPSPPRNKVMTPAEFEKYRKDKERRDSASETVKASTESRDDDDDQYEDDEDDMEKAKLAAKQRRKQEAHMAVYRQQMMKVTGEQPNLPSEHNARPSLSMSLSTPNLAVPPGPLTGKSDGSEEEDEEVPLAILAAHGFPNKNKPPARLMNMASNPDLRHSMQSQSAQLQRPGSSMGEGAGARASGGHLPAFARKLPQDPFLGAGLINAPPRESLTFGGGSPAPGAAPPPVPMGGLVGVIASEERSRAMRRGSPNIDAQHVNPFTGAPVDPNAGVPPQMMFGNMNGMNGGMTNGMNGGMVGMGQLAGMGGMGGVPQMPQMMLTPGDQAQIQMTQQMQQFMQMQMQFMQMMATPNQQTMNMNMNNGMARPMSHVMTPSINDSQRQSFFGDSMLEPPGFDARSRTMSMVQPSSASWIQPVGGYTPSIHGGMGGGGYTPSIHAQGNGYAPSIAPSERSNVGLPGRYRPVTHAPQPLDSGRRMSMMSGAAGWDEPPKVLQRENKLAPQKSGNISDDDEEEGWAAMKAKKEKKRSLWKTKKSIGSEIGALIS